MKLEKTESRACQPLEINAVGFNPDVALPYGCKTEHIHSAMNDFLSFLGLINGLLKKKKMARLESFIMPANFSSIVGEFMATTIPKYCENLARNQYHNGHPDMLPKGRFENDAVQHSTEGIEIKGSRYVSGWQGHNPENIWLMVFVFTSNTSSDSHKGIELIPFQFLKVLCAKLNKTDWTFAGRKGSSRRTITASVNGKGIKKMKANWIYDAGITA